MTHPAFVDRQRPEEGLVLDVALGPDAEGFAVGYADSGAVVWVDAASGAVRRTFSLELLAGVAVPPQPPARVLAWPNVGTSDVLLDWGFWDVETGEPVVEYRNVASFDVAFSRDGWVMGRCWPPWGTLEAVPGGPTATGLQWELPERCNDLAVSVRPDTLVTASWGGFQAVTSGEAFTWFDLGPYETRAVDLDLVGGQTTHLLAAGDAGLGGWSVASLFDGSWVGAPMLSTEPWQVMAASAEHARAVVGGEGGEMWVFDVETGDVLTRMTHVGGVASVDMSADGRFVLSGGVDGTVDLWDLSAL